MPFRIVVGLGPAACRQGGFFRLGWRKFLLNQRAERRRRLFCRAGFARGVSGDEPERCIEGRCARSRTRPRRRGSDTSSSGDLDLREAFAGRTLGSVLGFDFMALFLTFGTLASSPLRQITRILPICCTAAAPVLAQISADSDSRLSRSSLATRILISSWLTRARSISAITPGDRPASAIMTTGLRGWARALSALRSAAERVFMGRDCIGLRGARRGWQSLSPPLP